MWNLPSMVSKLSLGIQRKAQIYNNSKDRIGEWLLLQCKRQVFWEFISNPKTLSNTSDEDK